MSLLLGGVGGAGASGGGGGPTYWTPNDEAGLIAWFDVADLGDYNTTTDEWTARWGSLTLEAADVGPSTTTTGFGGSSNALVFTDSSNTGLLIPNAGFTDVIVALAMNVVTTADTILVWNRGFEGIATAGLMLVSTYGFQARYRGMGEAEDYSAAMPGQHLSITVHSDNLRLIRRNGATTDSDATSASGTEAASTESFELFRDVTDYGYSVQIAAVGLFDASVWSTGLAEKIEGFICHNNIGHTTAILPGGHPYKTTAPTV